MSNFFQPSGRCTDLVETRITNHCPTYEDAYICAAYYRRHPEAIHDMTIRIFADTDFEGYKVMVQAIADRDLLIEFAVMRETLADSGHCQSWCREND